jgi:hypothetical protein
MRFINLTPHPVNIYRRDGQGVLMRIDPEPSPLRLEEADMMVTDPALDLGSPPGRENRHALGNWEPEGNYGLSVPVVQRSYSAPAMPPAAEKTIYIVSLPALMGLRAAGEARADIVAPDTGPGKWGAVRDGSGNVVGCYRLCAIGPLPETDWGGPWSAEAWNAANP